MITNTPGNWCLTLKMVLEQGQAWGGGPCGSLGSEGFPEEQFVKYGGKFCDQTLVPHSHLSVSQWEIAPDISVSLLAALVLGYGLHPFCWGHSQEATSSHCLFIRLQGILRNARSHFSLLSVFSQNTLCYQEPREQITASLMG